MKDRLQRFWRERNQGERWLLGGLAALLFLAAYAWLVIEAGRARTELSATILSLRTQAASLERAAGEIEALRQRSAVKTAAADLRALAQAQAGAAGLTRALQRVDAPSAHQVQVSFAAAAFADWLVWLKGMQAQQLRVDSCRLEALSTPGLVSVSATLSHAAQQ